MTFRAPPVPPAIDAQALVRAIEDIWNSGDVEAVLMMHRVDCQWRERTEFLWGREQVRAFLERKWRRELDGRTIMELWTVSGARVTVRCCSEYRTDSDVWFRTYGNLAWNYDENGLIDRRIASINEHPIKAHERTLLWPQGPRTTYHASLEDLGF